MTGYIIKVITKFFKLLKKVVNLIFSVKQFALTQFLV